MSNIFPNVTMFNSYIIKYCWCVFTAVCGIAIKMRIKAFRLLTLLSVGVLLSLIVFWVTHLNKEIRQPADLYLKKLVNRLADYQDVLHFLENDNPQCHSLFSRSGWDVRMLHSAIFNDDYHRMSTDFDEKLTKEKIEISDNHSGHLIYLVLIYHLLAKQPWVLNVCEIGFGAGHGAISWISAKSDLKYYAFDDGVHLYTKQMADFLLNKYPNQFEIMFGNSVLTVPQFTRAKNRKTTCDVVVIDGSTDYSSVMADLTNMRYLANKDHPLVMLANYVPDSEDGPLDSNKAWKEAMKSGLITNVFSCVFLNVRNRGLTVGFYNMSGVY